MPASTTDVNKHLETLGLKSDDLNEDAVRVAYKKLALRWHPDRHNADPEEAKEKFIEVNEAYKALVEDCKKHSKRRKTRGTEDSPAARRPFWAGSTPSASSSSSSTPSTSSSSNSTTSASSSRSSCATDSTSEPTEIPPAKPTDSHSAKPSDAARSAHSTNPSSTKPADGSHAKPSHHTAEKRADTHKHGSRSQVKTRRSGDRDSSHPSPKAERSRPKPSHTSTTAHKSSHSFKTSNLYSDTDSDTSTEAGSPRDKHRHHHRSNERKLGDDDYEFIDLGTPLKPLRSPKTASSSTSKDWVFPLHLTLEDLYSGATHRYRITRTLRTPPRNTQTVQIDVQVAPGWRTGTRIRVPGVGNQRTDGSFQDIVFVVAEIAHPRFTREGDDLVLPVRVPWADAHSRPYPPCDLSGDDDSVLGHGEEGRDGGRYRFGFGRWRHHENAHGHGQGHGRESEEEEVYVLGMDGEEYTLPIPRTLVEAADGTRIFGAGMPMRKDGKVVGKGDLIIRWDFVFPESDKGQRSRWQTLKDAMHLRFQV